MKMYDFFHDPSLEDHYFPLGARKAGETVRLRFYVAKEKEMGEMFVSLHLIQCGGETQYQMMPQDGYFEINIVLPEKAMVLWYYFSVQEKGKMIFYGSKGSETAALGEIYHSIPPCFQITVYDQNFETPDFFKNAIVYQIFPDRFRRGNKETMQKGKAYHEAMGRTVVLHENFFGQPLFSPLPGKKDYTPCDYFGGNLNGIRDALSDLAQLGIRAIYLNPIFEADSNHRYNTADYKKIDPLLGEEADFIALVEDAAQYGIRILLDGVFSHTGSDSVYFNQKGNYPNLGAYQGEKSPYYAWYDFKRFPDEYRCWWGFPTLPEVNEENLSWQEAIIWGKDSVLKHWLRRGAAGYRFDVADELPDAIISLMRKAVKEENAESFLLGEVWEDATTKESYGVHRTYALGNELDSVMNYPFRSMCIAFFLQKKTAESMADFLMGQALHYPLPMYYCLMNLLSSHDVERIRTLFSIQQQTTDLSREQQAGLLVLPDQDRQGAALQKMAALLQFVLPGMPTIYYGDEVGMHGLKDPFNRAPYQPKDLGMKAYYQKLCKMRNQSAPLRTGYISCFHWRKCVLGVFRFILDGKDAFRQPSENGAFLAFFNPEGKDHHMVIDCYAIKRGIPKEQQQCLQKIQWKKAVSLETGKEYPMEDGLLELQIPEKSSILLRLMFDS